MTQNRPPFRVAALGEIAIRCHDLDGMESFYSDVIGLEKLATRRGGIIFFRIGEGYAGHTTVLALFAHDPHHDGQHPAPVTGRGSSLHHIALTVTAAEQEAAMGWYKQIGQPFRVEEFDWIGWRGLFTTDPEGNTVELVAATGSTSA